MANDDATVDSRASADAREAGDTFEFRGTGDPRRLLLRGMQRAEETMRRSTLDRDGKIGVSAYVGYMAFAMAVKRKQQAQRKARPRGRQ